MRTKSRAKSMGRRMAGVAMAMGALAWTGLAGCGGGEDTGNGAAVPPAAVASTPAATPVKETGPALPAKGEHAGHDHGEPAAPMVALPVVAEPARFDMGYMGAGEHKTASVNLRNTSDKPVEILKVQSSCKCTTLSDYHGTVIGPGQAVPITALFDAPHETGPKSQNVWVYLKGHEEGYLTIPVVGEVVLGVRAEPGFLSMQQTEAGFGPLKVESVDGEPFRVLSVDGKEPVYLDDYKAGGEPRSSYVLQWDLRPYMDPCNNMPWWVIVETDHPREPLLDVRVRHECTRVTDLVINGSKVFVLNRNQKWRVPEMRTLLGVTRPGQTVTVTVTTTELGPRELVVAVPLMSSIRDAKIVGSQVKNGEKVYEVEITPAPNVRGLYRGVVNFFASDHTHCPVWVYGVVRE